MRLGTALLVFLISTTAGAQQFATVTTNAPIYAAAQETPTPLRVAAVGTRLAVLSTDRDWVQVEYNDPQLGRRVGWVQRHFISLTSTDLRPMDLSVPEALPAPSVSVEATPAPPVAAASIPFPRAETLLGWSFLRVAGESLDMNSAIGWNVSVAGNLSPWVGIVGDVTGNYKGGSTLVAAPDVSIHTFTGGPRFSARTSAAGGAVRRVPGGLHPHQPRRRRRGRKLHRVHHPAGCRCRHRQRASGRPIQSRVAPGFLRGRADQHVPLRRRCRDPQVTSGSTSRRAPPTGDVAMWRWTSRIFVVLGAFLIAAALSGATYQWLATRKEFAATPPPGHLVDIGGYRLHLWCTGNGAPAVILDTGLGGSSAGWGFVQPDVARFTRVCSYDRAGMGYSDPGPSPRTARRIASELAELLDRSGIGDPLVLVGASSGGFNVRVFASDHSKRVAGLVLVDASHEDDAHEVPPMARFVPLLSTLGVFDCLACRPAFQSNRWRHQCGSSRARRVSAQPDTRRRLTRLFTSGRARRKSGARAASSPSLSSSSPAAGEPTRTGASCSAIKPRCQTGDA